MINKEEIEETKQYFRDFIIEMYSNNQSIGYKHQDFLEKLNNLLKHISGLEKNVDNLIKRNIDLEEINKEHQKLNGELQKKVTYYEEICKGKSIQELGMSDLYKED